MKQPEQTIEEYLSNETKLYQDWYTGLFEKSEDAQYMTEVGVIPDLAELKKLFEKWFKKQQDVIKNLCDDYCQNKHQNPSLLTAMVADGLAAALGNTPVNVAATAIILVAGKFLYRLCNCPKNPETEEE
jgi:hypothetical protein